jgi:hypothetical protein
MKYYVKTGITETGTSDAGTSEFSNLKTGTTGGFPLKTCNLCSLHNKNSSGC